MQSQGLRYEYVRLIIEHESYKINPTKRVHVYCTKCKKFNLPLPNLLLSGSISQYLIQAYTIITWDFIVRIINCSKTLLHLLLNMHTIIVLRINEYLRSAWTYEHTGGLDFGILRNIAIWVQFVCIYVCVYT